MVEEGPLCVFQTQISPEELHEHTNPSFLVKDENDGQHCNQSQHIEETTVYNEGLNRQEEEIIFFMNRIIFCLKIIKRMKM